MSRRLAVTLAVVTASAVATTPALAAKPKPKPIKGSYTLTLYPDVTQDATSQAKAPSGCAKVVPMSFNDHPFTVPAKGTLKVVLDAPSSLPSTPLGPDWDLWLLDSSGEVVDASHGATSHEETSTKFKKGMPVTFEVCNLTGQTSGTVTYTFTYT